MACHLKQELYRKAENLVVIFEKLIPTFGDDIGTTMEILSTKRSCPSRLYGILWKCEVLEKYEVRQNSMRVSGTITVNSHRSSFIG